MLLIPLNSCKFSFHHFLYPLLILLLVVECCATDIQKTPSHKSNIPVGRVQRLFHECAVKQRVDVENKKNQLQTIFAFAEMDNKMAVFFDSSYTGFVGEKSLLSNCKEDKEADMREAHKLEDGTCSGIGNNPAVTVTIVGQTNSKKKPKKLQLRAVSDHGGSSCTDSTKNHYYFYKCDSGLCHDQKYYVLLQRSNADKNEQLFYIDVKDAHCLPKVCGNNQRTMEPIYKKPPKEERKKLPKVKQHNLFQECAVERFEPGKKDSQIETLVKHIVLEGTDQTMFFGKGSNVYIGLRTKKVKDVCEEDKAARLEEVVPVSRAVVMFDGNSNSKLMFDYNSDELKTDNGRRMKVDAKKAQENRLRNKGDKSEELKLYTKKYGEKEHCQAKVGAGTYMVLICPKAVCESNWIVLMRKSLGKKKKMLIDVDHETLNVDHIYLVHYVKTQTLEKIMEECKGHVTFVEGVSRKGTKATGTNNALQESGGKDVNEARRNGRQKNVEGSQKKEGSPKVIEPQHTAKHKSEEPENKKQSLRRSSVISSDANKKNTGDAVKKAEKVKTAAAGSGSPSHPHKDNQHKQEHPQSGVGSKQHDHDNKEKTEKTEKAAPSAQTAHAKAISMRKEGTFSAETPEEHNKKATMKKMANEI